MLNWPRPSHLGQKSFVCFHVGGSLNNYLNYSFGIIMYSLSYCYELEFIF